MSTLKVDTIQDASGSNASTSEQINQGRAKAWINFDGTGTIAIRDSFNISSVTDGGTGIYTINFTNAMANSNYCSPCENGAPEGGRYIIGPESDGKTTSSARFFSQQSSTGGNLDADEVSIAIFGDQ